MFKDYLSWTSLTQNDKCLYAWVLQTLVTKTMSRVMMAPPPHGSNCLYKDQDSLFEGKRKKKKVRKGCSALSTIKFKKVDLSVRVFCRQPRHPLIIVYFCRTINDKETRNLRHSPQRKKISHRTRFRKKFKK